MVGFRESSCQPVGLGGAGDFGAPPLSSRDASLLERLEAREGEVEPRLVAALVARLVRGGGGLRSTSVSVVQEFFQVGVSASED